MAPVVEITKKGLLGFGLLHPFAQWLTILQVPPPSPLEHNKQSQTGYGLTTEVNLNGTIDRVSGELEGTRWMRDTDSGGNG